MASRISAASERCIVGPRKTTSSLAVELRMEEIRKWRNDKADDFEGRILAAMQRHDDDRSPARILERPNDGVQRCGPGGRTMCVCGKPDCIDWR